MLALSLCPFSRDVCALLALFAPSAPSSPRPDPSSSSPPSVDPGLLGWLLQHPPAAAAGLELATQALTWPDTEAAQKALILAAGAAQVRASPPRAAQLRAVFSEGGHLAQSRDCNVLLLCNIFESSQTPGYLQ
jgi:hypothetical protein